MKKFMVCCLVAMLSLGVLTGLAAADKLKVAFVYVSPAGDHGWTYAHDQGRKHLEEKFGAETAYTENVSGPDIERVIRGYAQKGYDMVFTTSFEYMDATMEVSEDFPDAAFDHCSGFKMTENAGNYFGRIYQARYLTGLVAGKMTKSNVLGYVAAHPIPEVIRGINAFTVGVREANPEAVVKVVWTNSWFDPAKEKEAGLSLLAADADVITQHQDSPAAQEAAQDNGKYSIGYHSDMSHFAPDAHLTAAVWNWKPYYERRAKEKMDGAWKPEAYWGGLGDGIVDIAPFGKMVPQDVQDMVMEKKQAIIDGKFKVFGDTSDKDLLSMGEFVEGVEGNIPK